MFIEPHLASRLPLRLPHWRLNRVTEMLGHRPQPLPARSNDDHPIRAYRRLLIDLQAAGDDEERINSVITRHPALYEAHRFHYSADFRQRQHVEARLLTRQPLDQIATDVGAGPKAIEYYAVLFFDVLDALEHRGWVLLTIRSRTRYDEQSGCSRDEAARGHALRLFGYLGGPLVLDMLIDPLEGIMRPAKPELVPAWSAQVVTQTARTLGTIAAATVDITDRNAMQIIRLAQRFVRIENEQSGSRGVDLSKHIEATIAELERVGVKMK